YVYDEEGLEDGCRAFAQTVAGGPAGSRGLYALKSFPAIAMARLAHQAGLGILCASSGEVAVAEAAGGPPGDRVLHGNNQSGAEQWAELAQLMVPLAAEVADAIGSPIRELDLGGGFGIAYTRDDPPSASPPDVAERILQHWPTDASLILEPGRALVGRPGVSLHRIGTVKEIPGVRTYVAVDGGMSDNIRPPLYGARYEFVLAERAEAPAEQPARIVGKHCESGDILAADAHLPSDPRPGELLVTLATGAYAWAMASNYNQIPRSAVVFCRDGRARVVVRRETTKDVLRLQE